MSILERPSRERPRPRRPSSRDKVGKVVLVLVLLVLAFVLGMSFARTLDERPEPGDAVTNVRTLTPLPQQPPVRTVTVTVTSP